MKLGGCVSNPFERGAFFLQSHSLDFQRSAGIRAHTLVNMFSGRFTGPGQPRLHILSQVIRQCVAGKKSHSGAIAKKTQPTSRTVADKGGAKSLYLFAAFNQDSLRRLFRVRVLLSAVCLAFCSLLRRRTRFSFEILRPSSSFTLSFSVGHRSEVHSASNSQHRTSPHIPSSSSTALSEYQCQNTGDILRVDTDKCNL